MSRATLRPNDLPELGAKLIHELTSSFTISVTYLDQLPKCLDSGLKQHRERKHNSDKWHIVLQFDVCQFVVLMDKNNIQCAPCDDITNDQC